MEGIGYETSGIHAENASQSQIPLYRYLFHVILANGSLTHLLRPAAEESVLAVMTEF